MMTTTIYCPECDGEIEVTETLFPGEILVCPHCGAELEVISVTPLVVEVAPEVEEDWGE
jgi:alpha-aminoadipate carrier protein LysW